MLNNFSPVYAWMLTFMVSLIYGYWLIPHLKKKRFGQEIRQDGPQMHMRKKGTLTMGGLIFIVPITLVSLFFLPWNRFFVLFGLVGFGLLGWIDDSLKIKKKNNEGLKPQEKLIGQLILAVAIALIFSWQMPSNTLFILNKNLAIQVMWLKFVVDVLVLISIPNAVNLTDGLDGLASMSSLPVLLSFAILALLLGSPTVLLVSGIAFMALLAFMVFNWHPAKIFMGDTGSLALGGLLGTLAMVLGVELSLLILCGLYVIETLSVIFQVGYFKITKGKRLFLMSPIHHHFELRGWGELKVVIVFSFASLLFAALGLMIFIM